MLNFLKFYFQISKAVFVLILLLCAAVFVRAQSSDQNFPTPVTSNEISGTVRARDIGDSRLTTYFYTFNGTQGDIFINVVTNNFNGDIDVFAADGLRPLSKIVVYADSTDNETGRVIYLRKPEKILLRIQGRTPNDDPATFRFKFAGSFVASAETEQTEAPKLPEVTRENDSGVIVNSVGTIIAVKPKPTPEPRDVAAEKTPGVEKTEEETPVAVEDEENRNEAAERAEVKTEPEKTQVPKVIVTDELENRPPSEPTETVADTDEDKKDAEVAAEKVEPPAEIPPVKDKVEENKVLGDEKPEIAAEEKTERNRNRSKKEKEPNPLENIRLVVLLKDGGKIERPMSEVLKFGVEKGILTIIHKDGSISRYSILDVEKITVQ